MHYFLKNGLFPLSLKKKAGIWLKKKKKVFTLTVIGELELYPIKSNLEKISENL